MKDNMKDTDIKLVETFCCPGCVAGSDTSCGEFSPSDDPKEYGVGCTSHVAGTHMMPGGRVYLGMPKGFNKVGAIPTKRDGANSSSNIRIWPKDDDGQPTPAARGWNHLNVPVWAMERDGFLYVRTFAPRIGRHWIDVIEGGTLDMVPTAINVADLIDTID